MEKKKLSIVVPIFNEENNIFPLYQDLILICQSLNYFQDYEVIMVNDGSRDASLSVLKKLAALDNRVKVISFTRNFGHEYATFAGLTYASGDAVVLIDADRQDPPQLIHEFEKEFVQGYHIVYGQRSQRLHESWLKRLTSKLFYPIFKWITGIDMPRDVGDFCMLSRKAVDLMKQYNERTIFIRGLIYWLGLSKKAVPFIRQARGAGKSKYNYAKLIIFAIENIISFSTIPLYAIIFLAISLITACCVVMPIALVLQGFGLVAITGWFLCMVGMIFAWAVLLLFVGIVGLYVGKISQDVKARPLFIIDEVINL